LKRGRWKKMMMRRGLNLGEIGGLGPDIPVLADDGSSLFQGGGPGGVFIPRAHLLEHQVIFIVSFPLHLLLLLLLLLLDPGRGER